MKSRFILMSFVVLLLCSVAASAATPIAATNPQDAAALMYISGYDMTPGVFYPGEYRNDNRSRHQCSEFIRDIIHTDLMDPHVSVTSKTSENTPTNLGPGQTADFSFQVTVKASDGTISLCSLYPLRCMEAIFTPH